MESNNVVKILDESELYNIMSCLEQFVIKTELPKDEFYVISIWYPNIANEYFNSNTQSNSYMIIPKYENNFTQKNIVEHAKKIYDAGLIPIEIVQDTGAYFYSIPKIFIENKDLRSCVILPAEHLIPLLDDFM
jgi:hypothetical protein